MDVVAAFLAATLPKEDVVYIRLPPELQSQFGDCVCESSKEPVRVKASREIIVSPAYGLSLGDRL